jgi:hypothetical protein
MAGSLNLAPAGTAQRCRDFQNGFLPMAHPVFISYARRSSGEHARTLHEMLGGREGHAFLDTSDLDEGSVFSNSIADALLASRVVVIFADDLYFERWYCLRELRMALAPYYLLQDNASQDALKEALKQVVIVLPNKALPPGFLSLPPLACLIHQN